MKLTLDPMPALRRAAKGKVNTHFNNLAQTHRDAAYIMKRATAGAGAPFPDWFTQEADLRGIVPAALASLILSKPDVLSERELLRQRAMAAIDNATSPDALTAIVDKLRFT
jgi:hypothetical protein